MNNFIRILSYIKTLSDSSFNKANFETCIFTQLGLKEDEERAHVGCFLQDNKFHIFPAKKDDAASNGYILMHPVYCPLKELANNDDIEVSSDAKERGVDVAVAIIAESCEGLILLTRRAKHMRTFPGLWVPPGGHIEQDESLLDAGLRELEEETGLQISPEEKNQSSILGLWESAYPAWIGLGAPRRHHIVVYMHIPLSGNALSYKPLLKLNPDEVEACAWVDDCVIQSVVSGVDLPETSSIEFTSVNINGEHVHGQVDMAFLADKLNIGGRIAPSNNRVSTGSRYALGLWLEKKKKLNTQSKSSL